MGRIRNNFYLSFLSINFVNLRPFHEQVQLEADMTHNVLPAQFLNAIDNDTTQEYGNSIRRHFLNDMVIAYERFSMLMIASHNNAQRRIDPALIDDRTLRAHLFEQLPEVYEPADSRFLVQLRRLRNSIVHYNGVYSTTNELDYTFDTETYKSKGREGTNISVQFNTLTWIYGRLIDTVEKGNTNYFNRYPPREL